MRLRDGVLYLVCGSSRSGKTGWTVDQLRNKKRVFIWDPEESYQCDARLYTKNQLAQALNHYKHKAGVIAYTGNLGDFPVWAEAAFLWAQLGHRANVYSCVVCEEVSDVVGFGKAPEKWGTLLRRGLKRACDIYAITQSPAESDKTTVRNASVVHCCRLSSHVDRKYMAQLMNVEQSEIDSLLSDTQSLQFPFIECDMRTMKTKKGVWTPKNAL